MLVALLFVAFWLMSMPVGAESPVRDTQIFRGEYEWVVDGHRNVVESIFREKGEGLWEVEFNFQYARRLETYRGEAEGNLSSGTVSGKVRDGQGKVRYGFEVVVKGDRLEGKHFDIWSGKKKLTGKISLVRVPSDVDDSQVETSDRRTGQDKAVQPKAY